MKTIFLADDDADDRMFFEDALRVLATPTQLTISTNGLELMSNLEILVAHPPPDVIFLDLNMPFKDGLECLKEIRETPKLKEIPVVIFSTSKSEEVIDKTYQVGAHYYICKPSSFDLLVKAIQMILSIELWQTSKPSKENFFLSIT